MTTATIPQFNSVAEAVTVAVETLYTCPAGAQSSILFGFTVANTVVPADSSAAAAAAATRFVTVNAIKADGVTLKSNYGTNLPVPPGGVLNLADKKATLLTGESIQISGSAVGLSADLGILENMTS